MPPILPTALDQAYVPLSRYDAFKRACLRGTAAFMRQSMRHATTEAEGSRMMQADHCAQAIEAHGVPKSCVRELTAWGESASPHNRSKKQFERLREMVRTREIGAVFLPEVHRLSRTVLDAEGLFEDAAQNGVWFCAAGQILNPAEPNDRLVLRMLVAAAEHMVQGQNKWEMDAVFTLARRLEFRLRLPTGLVWADPRDLTYQARLREAGLSDWIAPERLKEHRAVSDPNGTPRYVLPFPDRRVYLAARKCCDWFVETQSIPTVHERVMRGAEGWPEDETDAQGRKLIYKGKLPFVGSVWTPDLKADWRASDPKRIRQWLQSPAMGGIYTIYVERLAEPVVRADRRARRASVHYPRAILESRAALPTGAGLLAAAVRRPQMAPDNPS